MKWLILAIGILCNAAASLLVKKAVEPPRQLPSIAAPWGLFTNWPLLVGLGLYGGAFLVYAVALTRLPINVAHPILTSGAIATVAVGAGVFYNETFQVPTIVGIVLVVVGVILIASTQA